MSDTTALTLAGTPEVLLSHMSLLGTALIIEERLGAGSVTCHWQDGADPLPILTVNGATREDIGLIIRDHAADHVGTAATWIRAAQPVVGSLFSARTKMPSTPEQWERLLAERGPINSGLRGLDSRMVLGIGERAWWLDRPPSLRPDHGASAWEMKTRNKGMEFVKDGLEPIARAVAAREPLAVLSGLTGETFADEVAKGRPDSRTGMGLSPLGPMDSARAWTGLWGIAALPVWPQVTRRSVNSAALPGKKDELGRLCMAVPMAAVTPSRWVRMLRSSAIVTSSGDQDAASAADSQLKAWGAGTLLTFPVSVTGSTSAPERRALTGQQVLR
ncbi:MAG: hypothetical protein Q4G34_00930 [Micrococcus sp.]|nr:hypothetical protein [Micrococcus sp.]